MQDPKNKTENTVTTASERYKGEAVKASRRRLLQMGAAGLPMVLTLRASASEAVVSQLRCLFVLPDNIKILVDDEGRAWVGNGDIETGNSGYKTSDIEAFKSNADYVFPAGSVPESYRPDACQNGGGGQCGDDDDDWGGGHHWASATSDEYGYTSSDNLGRSGGSSWGDDDDCGDDDWGYSSEKKPKKPNKPKGGGHDDDDDDDDGGNGGWTDCGYNLYDYGSNYSIKPGDYVNDGSWNLSGDSGLFLTLSILYADEYGNTGSWPGVSCIVSVLNYLGQ